MRLTTGVISTLVASSLCAGVAAAQTCLGRPYFSTGPLQFGAIADFGGDVSSVGAHAAYGKPRSYFLSGHAVRAQLDRSGPASTNDPAGMTLNVTGGVQVDYGRGGRAQFCPTFSASWGNVDITPGATLRRSEIAVGGMFGYVHASNAGLHLVPYGGASIAQLDRRIEIDGGGDTNFGADLYYPVTGGVGLHFEDVFMISAQLMFPVELRGADPVFGIRMMVPVGGGRR